MGAEAEKVLLEVLKALTNKPTPLIERRCYTEMEGG